MKRMLTGFVLVALLVAAPSAQAQYPYTLDTGREATLLGSGFLLTSVSLRLERGLDPLSLTEIMDLDASNVNVLDRGTTGTWNPSAAKTSDLLLAASTLAPYALLLTDQGSKEPWVIGLMAAETQLLNLGATLVIKNSVARTRPYVYDRTDAVPSDIKHQRDARRSFPSGHTSNAFAPATFLGVVNEKLHPGSSANPWVWAGAYGVAATTGILRVAAGKHFPTDVLAGAALGTFVGWLVPKLHEPDLEGGNGTEPLNIPIARVSFSF